MKVYATWTDFLEADQGFTNLMNTDTVKKYCGFTVLGSTAERIFELILNSETFAILADADEKDVREYIKERTDGGADFYYRIEETPAVMTYNGFALIRGEYRLDGTKDVETEEVLCEGTSDDAGIDEDSEEADWNMIDEFIQNAIGYVPNYETGVY